MQEKKKKERREKRKKKKSTIKCTARYPEDTPIRGKIAQTSHKGSKNEGTEISCE